MSNKNKIKFFFSKKRMCFFVVVIVFKNYILFVFGNAAFDFFHREILKVDSRQSLFFVCQFLTDSRKL